MIEEINNRFKINFQLSKQVGYVTGNMSKKKNIPIKFFEGNLPITKFCPSKIKISTKKERGGYTGIQKLKYKMENLEFTKADSLYYLRFDNEIPELEFLDKMAINHGRNLLLLNFNNQFYEDKKQRIKNYYSMVERYVYRDVIEPIVGGIFKRNFKKRLFQFLVPISRSINGKAGNIVFQVNEELTKINKDYTKNKTRISKVKMDTMKKSCVFKIAIETPIINTTLEDNAELNTMEGLKKMSGERVQTDGEREGKIRRKNEISISKLNLEFAPMSQFFYIEFNMFEEIVWYRFLTKDQKNMMNLRKLEFLLEQCFIMYWPKLDQNDPKTNEYNAIEPEPTFNFYIPFRYDSKRTLMKRIWVKFDYFVEDEVLDIECESQFGNDEEDRKKKNKLSMKKKKLHL